MVLNKEKTEILVNLKDVAVGLSIICNNQSISIDTHKRINNLIVGIVGGIESILKKE